MTGIEIMGLALTLLGLIGGLEMRVRALVKVYLSELKPNSGSSLRDEVKEIHAQVDTILKIIHKDI